MVSVLAVCLAGGCAGLPEKPLRKADSFSKEFRHLVLESLRTRNREIKTFRAFATARYGSKLFNTRGNLVVLIKSPYYLRIDSLSPVGLYDSQVVISRGDLTIYWSGENRYFRGLATPDALARYLSVALDPEAMIQLVAGGVPVEDDDNYTLRTRKAGEEMVLRSERGELVVTRREETFLPLRYTAFDIDGRRRYFVEFGGYEKSGTRWSPRRLLASFWDPRARLEINYQEMEINPLVEDRLFQLKIPDDAARLSE